MALRPGLVSGLFVLGGHLAARSSAACSSTAATFMVSRPTMIGIGVHGLERVSITPIGGRAGGGGGVTVNINAPIGIDNLSMLKFTRRLSHVVSGPLNRTV
jgi:hypothetical protein